MKLKNVKKVLGIDTGYSLDDFREVFRIFCGSRLPFTINLRHDADEHLISKEESKAQKGGFLSRFKFYKDK